MTGLLTVDLEDARAACLESVRELVAAAEGVPELDLLGASRCHGWSRLDVVVHVVGGWHEMLGGLVSTVDDEPTVDAASYWPAFTATHGGGDPVPPLMAQRRRTAAYARPAAAVEHLRDVGDALARGVASFGDRRCRWDGHVFSPGDFLAIWAVEDAVHHLDLLAGTPPSSALALTRRTVEALCPVPLPPEWSDVEAVLVGTGRAPLPEGHPALAGVLPVLG